MEKKITVFTPTYNRAFCLGQCYDSLVRQTCENFIWLIIDDGSTDNTKTLVQQWIKQNKIDIIYHYQENQGMHGAHNTAYKLITTELNVCIDSDDFMSDNAIELIYKVWDNAYKTDDIAGIIALDAFKNNEIIGSKIPENLEKTTLEDLYHIHKAYGDKKLVLRTEIVNKFERYPIFKEERFVPLDTLYLMIDKEYKLLCLNEVLCIVEYMEDGSSRNIFKQYLRHPRGFIYARKMAMAKSNFLKVRLKNNIHFISHCLYLNDFKQLFHSPKPVMTLFLLPCGIALYIFIKLRVKNLI